MEKEPGSLVEWLLPLAFIVCAGWAIWHIPAYLLDFIPSSDQSLTDQISALQERKDVTPNLPGLFGGVADILDWGALILMPIFFYFGARTVRCTKMEYEHWRPIDRIALFVGRITMMLILIMTGVMLYEVTLRYFFHAPTLWANELTLWIAGFVFLLSGFYAMQQRCYIRIFIIYDLMPRWIQHIFDMISVALIWLFTIGLIFGSYKQIFVTKFYRWEMFGTAFDPPIPATLQPMILIMMSLIAIQALLNLIYDWNIDPSEHAGVDDIDQEELDAIKRSVGEN